MIDRFDEKYSFLSNFEPVNIVEVQSDGTTIVYPTVEHAFQAAKTDNIEERVRISKEETPGKAKRAGGKRGYITLRHNWDQLKDSVMIHYLRLKFSCPELREKLLATEDECLIEGNNWNDTYWGVCSSVGENRLGQLLMQVRAELKDTQIG